MCSRLLAQHIPFRTEQERLLPGSIPGRYWTQTEDSSAILTLSRAGRAVQGSFQMTAVAADGSVTQQFDAPIASFKLIADAI